MKRLEGKHIFLTGAAQGIGAAMAHLFVQEGAKVCLVDRQAEVLQQLMADFSPEADVMPWTCDITDRQSVKQAVAAMHQRWGRIDTLINNAGITRDALTAKMTDEQWDAVLNVNLKAPFICVQEAFPFLKEQGGAIVNAISVSALGNMGQANYAASKSGLIGLTKTWALEFARFGIRVNGGPGFTQTAMVETVPEHIQEKLLTMIPLRRFANPIEIAEAYCFLASESARYVTGQVLYVDGGLTCGF